MKLKKIPIILTVLFFSFMVFMSFFSRSIHNRLIPNVKVARLPREKFTYEQVLEDGTIQNVNKLANAIPKKMYDEDFLYVVVQGFKNGDERTFARKITLPIGAESNGYYEITELFYDVNRLFIMETNKEIYDGIEVYVVK